MEDHGTPKVRCPEGRISSPTQFRDGREVINTDTYIPYFLAAINNALQRGASARYLDAYGIGVGEWRVLSMLADEPGTSAARICDVISLDKGAVSRSLKKLDDLGFLSAEALPRDPRRKALSLNAKGYALHDEILGMALQREEDLIRGVDPEDLEVFLDVMRQMRRNVDVL